MSVISRSRLVVLSCRSQPFSVSEMAANETAKKNQIEELKEEIRTSRASHSLLGNQGMSREELLTFDLLERYPLVTDQKAYTFQWDRVNGLYQFEYKLPAWAVDDDIMEVWRTGMENAPQSLKGWNSEKAEWGQALLLSWANARISDGAVSHSTKVFTAVVVCIHPCQVVMSIQDGANDLIHHSIKSPDHCMSALCHLPRRSVRTFYPTPLNHSYLVLPYFRLPGEEKKVRLDMSVLWNRHMLVRRPH